MYKEFPPGGFGNLRLPGDHIVRTRELRYKGPAHNQVSYFHVRPLPFFPGAEDLRDRGT